MDDFRIVRIENNGLTLLSGTFSTPEGVQAEAERLTVANNASYMVFKRVGVCLPVIAASYKPSHE